MGGSVRTATVAAAVVASSAVLAMGVGASIDEYRARADRQREDSVSLWFLECIETAVLHLTTPGDVYRLVVSDSYLLQRVTEIAYPRIDLTDDLSADVLELRPRTNDEAGDCATLTIRVVEAPQ